jgi:hypothetical protein
MSEQEIKIMENPDDIKEEKVDIKEVNGEEIEEKNEVNGEEIEEKKVEEKEDKKKKKVEKPLEPLDPTPFYVVPLKILQGK